MYKSANFRARQISREKDLKRNSDYWLGNPLPHIPKITFESIFRIFCHIHHVHVMQRRHALQTGYVFLGILAKTGQWIRRPDFYRFSLWFYLKFPIKNNRTLPILTKLYKTWYTFTKYYFMLLCYITTFSNAKRNHPCVEGLALFGA